MSSLVPRPSTLLMVAALTAGAFWLQHGYPGLSEPQRLLAQLAPLGVATFGLALSLWFHRGRIALVFLLLGLAYAVPWLYRPPDGEGLGRMYSGIALLIPVNLLLFGYLAERGVRSAAGLARLALLAVQGGLVTWGAVAPASPVAELLMTDGVYSVPRYGGLSPVALGLYAVAGVGLLARYIYRRHPLDVGLLGALAATFPALYSGGEVGMTVAFWGLAGLLLALAMVQESYRLAFIDELTGLPGRRALEEQLHSLGGTYAMAMSDVDHFKKFNDTHGHDVGDQVLKMVAAHLKRVGGGGRPFRYGGEEFTVLFPGRSAKEAAVIMDDVREGLAGAGFRLRDKDRTEGEKGSQQRGKGGGDTVSVTISVGVAERDDQHPRSEEVIKAADEALYRAKKGGRNRVAH